jgi:hypothetical protein
MSILRQLLLAGLISCALGCAATDPVLSGTLTRGRMYRGPVPAESETQPYEDLPTGARIEIHTQYIVITLKDGISLIGPHSYFSLLAFRRD